MYTLLVFGNPFPETRVVTPSTQPTGAPLAPGSVCSGRQNSSSGWMQDVAREITVPGLRPAERAAVAAHLQGIDGRLHGSTTAWYQGV